MLWNIKEPRGFSDAALRLSFRSGILVIMTLVSSAFLIHTKVPKHPPLKSCGFMHLYQNMTWLLVQALGVQVTYLNDNSRCHSDRLDGWKRYRVDRAEAGCPIVSNKGPTIGDLDRRKTPTNRKSFYHYVFVSTSLIPTGLIQSPKFRLEPKISQGMWEQKGVTAVRWTMWIGLST
jgi:hypothetical protein